MSTLPDLDKLIKDLEASPLKFWIDRNASLSVLESLGEQGEPALGAVLEYLCRASSLARAAGVFRSVGLAGRKYTPTLIQRFTADTKVGHPQKAVGMLYAMALLKRADDQYSDDLKEVFGRTIADPALASGLRFCSALGARNHGFMEASDAEHIMYEHIEALVTNRANTFLFPPLAVAEQLLLPFLPSAFRKHDHRPQWGLGLDLPRWVDVYDVDNPGSLGSRISSETPLWLVNAGIPDERCNVKSDDDLTESDIAQAKEELESNPHPLRQYRRISLKWITVGKENNKRALEHIHALDQSVPKQLRQIGFAHRNRAYMFTFSTSPERYETADKWFFEPVISGLDFY